MSFNLSLDFVVLNIIPCLLFLLLQVTKVQFSDWEMIQVRQGSLVQSPYLVPGITVTLNYSLSTINLEKKL